MKKQIANIVNEHEVVVRHFKEHGSPILKEIVESIMNCFRQGGKLLLAGNGGSASDCQHIAGEFVGRYRRNRKALPAISLATDTAVLTCIGNDYDYNSIFSRQVRAIGKSRDVLWVFSTSGSSKNILEAVIAAKEKDITVIAFTGKPKSTLESNADICLCANTDKTNHAQEVHQLAYHIICEIIDDMV